ncbi:hypothetical protein GCM10009550_20670 [Actinocorallia libanotica]|uniref:Uncharacterized protein n=1 Tax=Actinocorallia libanotica TaxID=46162 RepID=A0ABP4B9P1_9ACTN
MPPHAVLVGGTAVPIRSTVGPDRGTAAHARGAVVLAWDAVGPDRGAVVLAWGAVGRALGRPRGALRPWRAGVAADLLAAAGCAALLRCGPLLLRGPRPSRAGPAFPRVGGSVLVLPGDGLSARHKAVCSGAAGEWPGCRLRDGGRFGGRRGECGAERWADGGGGFVREEGKVEAAGSVPTLAGALEHGPVPAPGARLQRVEERRPEEGEQDGEGGDDDRSETEPLEGVHGAAMPWSTPGLTSFAAAAFTTAPLPDQWS